MTVDDSLTRSLTPVWNDDVDTELVLLQRRRVTHDVVTFVFAAAEPRLFEFDPGQFMTFRFDIEGHAVERCYTISSSPARPYTVSVTVKRKVGGVVSNWLHDHLQVGQAVQAQGPLGQFTIRQARSDKLLLLSAGSGVTPMMSMLRSVYDLGQGISMNFVHSARSPEDIIFRAELSDVAAHSANITVTHVCEADSAGEHWQGHRGRISLQILEQVCPDLADRDVFVCGPQPYMDAVGSMLAHSGFDMQRFHQESFDLSAPFAPAVTGGPDPLTEPARAAVDEAPMHQTHTVSFVRSGRSIQCSPTTTVLDAARTAGIVLASSCAQGLCGTCKVTLLSGEVDMRHNGGIRPKEIQRGKVLLCCSTPTTSLEIDA